MAAPLNIRRRGHEPVLTPRAELDEAAVYNPGVCVLDGTLFLIPRVRLASTRESCFGLAWSTDGQTFRRLDHAIMVGSAPYERPLPDRPRETGGVEDCRVTVLGGRLYLVYTAYNRRCHLALAQMEVETFLELWRQSIRGGSHDLSARWDRAWTRLGPLFPEMLHTPDGFSRNGCLFTHGGRYYLFCRKGYGDMELTWAERPAGPFLPTPTRLGPQLSWEQDRVGICSPPLLMEQGELLFLYHGVEPAPPSGELDHQRTYHLGALTARFSRSQEHTLEVTRQPRPVLSPEGPWEVSPSRWLYNNEVKVAAVFACGMARFNDEILVPYGAGDHHICLGILDK